MIIYAMCDYLATQDYSPGAKKIVEVTVNGGEPHLVEIATGLMPKLSIPTDQLRRGDNHINFDGHVPGALFRAVFTYWQRDKEIKPLNKGLAVTRTYWLLDDNGRQLREIKAGDSVPRGSYILSQVSAKHQHNQSMQYVLVENAKPSTCEILPVTDKRFNHSSTTYALREDKTKSVVYHHENTGHTITNRCVLHAELAGNYMVPPANVELMYETLTRGHSGAFHFRVEDIPARN